VIGGASTSQKAELYLDSIGARRFVAPLPFIRYRTLYLESIRERRFRGRTVPREPWSMALCRASTGHKVELYLESTGARHFLAPLPFRGRTLYLESIGARHFVAPLPARR
jgi:hypothetical protein